MNPPHPQPIVMHSRRPAYRPPVQPLPLSEKLVLALIAVIILALVAGLVGSAIACFTNPY